jgi:pyruvate kinase
MESNQVLTEYGLDALSAILHEIAREKGYVTKGDFLINLAAMPLKDKGMVNTLRVSEVM